MAADLAKPLNRYIWRGHLVTYIAEIRHALLSQLLGEIWKNTVSAMKLYLKTTHIGYGLHCQFRNVHFFTLFNMSVSIK
jgi:hypothetical protein